MYKTKFPQTGVLKDFNSLSCVVVMIEQFKKSLDQGGDYATLLTDISKAFDCLAQDLHAYEFNKAL